MSETSSDYPEGATPKLHVTPTSRERSAEYEKKISEDLIEVDDSLARAAARASALEQKKLILQSLKSKQEGFTAGYGEVLNRLTELQVSVYKDAKRRARQVAELEKSSQEVECSLLELKAIDRKSWPEHDFEQELTAALAVIAGARKVVLGVEAQLPEGGATKHGSRRTGGVLSFWYWLMVGVAVSIPLMLAAILVCLLVLFLQGML